MNTSICKAHKKLQVADRISNMSTYVFAEIAERKKSLDPNWLIDLSLGSPDKPTPSSVLEGFTRASKNIKNHGYPRFNGKEELIQEIGVWYKKRFGIQLNESQILPLMGSKEGLAHLPLVYINPGDISIIPDPHYPVHYRGTVIANGQVYDLPLMQENNFLPDFNSIPKEVAEKAKLMIISYPNNPTGAISTPEFLKDLTAFCRKYKILLCHDLAYSELGFYGHRPQSIFEHMSLDEPAIEFFSFSKTYHMAGWRIGFCVGNSQVVQNLYSLKTNMDYGISGTIQEGSIEALRLPESYYNEVSLMYQNRAELLYKELVDGLGWDIFKPQGAMYLWVPAPKKYEGDGTKFSIEMLEKVGVVSTPGLAFGENGRNYVRFALVQPEDKLKESAKRIVDYFSKI